MKRSILIDLAIPSTLKVKLAYKVKTIKCTLKSYPKPIQYGTLKQGEKIQLSANSFLRCKVFDFSAKMWVFCTHIDSEEKTNFDLEDSSSESLIFCDHLHQTFQGFKINPLFHASFFPPCKIVCLRGTQVLKPLHPTLHMFFLHAKWSS